MANELRGLASLGKDCYPENDIFHVLQSGDDIESEYDDENGDDESSEISDELD